jgi:hypothetical protein
MMTKPIIFEPYYKIESREGRHYLYLHMEDNGERIFVYPYISKGAAEMVGERALKRRKLVSHGI